MSKLNIGIDLGGTNMACGVCDDNGKILFKQSIKTLPKRPCNEILTDMANLIIESVQKAGFAMDDVKFCGIASPGIANTDFGTIEYSANFPTFINAPIVAEIKRQTGINDVRIENDANAAAKGEAEVGAAKGAESSVLITLGTGVGGGVITKGKILHGINFAGGELGHIVIVANGNDCPCGRKGCWETYSSATGLIKMTREMMENDRNSKMWEIAENLESVDGRTAYNAMYKGDESAKKVVDKYVFYLACGITNIVNIFEPEIISIGGGVSGEGENLLKPLREIVYRDMYSRNCKIIPKIMKAELGNDAGIIGAALLWK